MTTSIDFKLTAANPLPRFELSNAPRFKAIMARLDVFDLVFLMRPECARILMLTKVAKLVPNVELTGMFTDEELDTLDEAITELETSWHQLSK